MSRKKKQNPIGALILYILALLLLVFTVVATLFIWIGCVSMMLGGFMSLLDRRLRVGAPAARRTKPATPALEAAE